MVLSSEALLFISFVMIIGGLLASIGIIDFVVWFMTIVLAIVMLAMKAYLPPEVNFFIAVAIALGNLVSHKGRKKVLSSILQIILVACVCIGLFLAKAYLSDALLEKLSLSIVFLGVIKFLMF
jgi:Na+-transporting methylmalonyl-CoA/oxaloacetate decarboxylase beta subunit